MDIISLKEFLDIDKWDQTYFVTSIDKIICPSCSEVAHARPPRRANEFCPCRLCQQWEDTGLWSCRKCQTQFQVVVVQSPLGPAWRSEAPADDVNGGTAVGGADGN